MKLIRYRRALGSEIVDELDNFLYSTKKEHLGAYDREKMLEFFNQCPSRYTIIEFPEPEKQNPLWRLSGIFFLILGGLMFCAMPFKWFLTGKAYYDYHGNLYKFLTAWANKLDY